MNKDYKKMNNKGKANLKLVNYPLVILLIFLFSLTSISALKITPQSTLTRDTGELSIIQTGDEENLIPNYQIETKYFYKDNWFDNLLQIIGLKEEEVPEEVKYINISICSQNLADKELKTKLTPNGIEVQNKTTKEVLYFIPTDMRVSKDKTAKEALKSITKILKKDKDNSLSSTYEKGDNYCFYDYFELTDKLYRKYGEHSIVIENRYDTISTIYNENSSIGVNYLTTEGYNESLVFFMPFEVGNSTFTPDVSDSGFTGNVVNAVHNSSGKIGSAFEFDGSTTNIDTTFNGTQYTNLTFTVWAKMNNNGTQQRRYILDNTPASEGFMIGSETTDKMNIFVYYDSVGLKSAETDINIPDGNWHFYAVKITPTNVYIKIDDRNFQSSGADFASDTIVDSPSLMIIGSAVGGSGFWDGTIDEVMIWNRELSDAEVTEIYTNQLKKYSSQAIVSDIWQTLPTGYTDISVNIQNFYKEGLANATVDLLQWEYGDGYLDWLSSSTDSMLDGNVLYMHLDNNSAIGENDTLAVDSSIGSNNGTIANAALGSGKFGNAYVFDGDTDFITTTLNPHNDLEGKDFTISLWAYLDEELGNTRYLISPASGAPRFYYRIETDGDLFWGLGSGAQDFTTRLTPNKWEHIVSSFDYSEGSMSIYLDGIFDSSVVSADFNATLKDANMIISESGSDAWNGSIDEVMIFNRSLNENEIKRLYTNQLLDVTDRNPIEITSSGELLNEEINQSKSFYKAEFVLNSQDNNTILIGNTSSDYAFQYTLISGLNNLSFEYPTPELSAKVISPLINISLSSGDLTELKYNWNGTNYTFYDEDLKLMMNFNDWNRLNDTSMFYNNATNQGAYYNTSGKYGSAYSFYGGDYLEIADADSLDGYDEMTISTWVKPYETSYADSGIIGRARASGTYSYDTKISGDTFKIKIWNTGGTSTEVNSGVDITDTSKWYHLVGTYNGSHITTYVDGVRAGSQGTLTGTVRNSGNTLWIGCYYDTSYCFDGLIDEVQIWNKSFSDEEIAQQYMSNLYKHSDSGWNLEVNQTKNVTDNLGVGDYTYGASSLISGADYENISRNLTILNGDYDYPIFSNIEYNPANNSEYSGSSIKLNATIENTNGTVWVQYGTTNYFATNVSNEFEVNIGELSVGTYYFNYSAYGNGTSNNFNITSFDYVIRQGIEKVQLTLDGKRGNVLSDNDTVINISVTQPDIKGILNLYIDNVLWNSGMKSISNSSLFLEGIYEINATMPSTTNYTYDDEVWFLTIVNSTTPSSVTSLCRYKKFGYYNSDLPFLKEVNCI